MTFVTLSATPQCPTCRHCVPQGVNIAGKHSTELVCERHLVCFPDATHCRDYEREPGAD